mgnify:CR=1 FL=1
MHFGPFSCQKMSAIFLSHNCDLHDLSDLQEKIGIRNCKKKRGQIYTFQKSINLNNYLNMAWLVGVRKSKIRLSSLVSWLTLILSPSSDSSSAVTLRLASSICNGNWGSEAETTQICLTWSSTSFCVQPSTFSGDFLTSAWTSTMLSLEILKKGLKSRSGIFFPQFSYLIS